MIIKSSTLVLVMKGEEVLLGMKKRGFGAGLWNGFGGKVHAGESVEEAARRELLEECGIIAKDLHDMGKAYFTFETMPDVLLETTLYTSTEFQGDVQETEEMMPQWFNVEKVPYETMWTADRYWLPHVLAGKRVHAEISFDSPENQTILQKQIRLL